MNEVEEQKVTAVLTSKGITDVNEHFFHNKEYWYQRVRMPPRKADKAYRNLKLVINFFETSDAFNEYASKELIKYLHGWANRCREGR